MANTAGGGLSRVTIVAPTTRMDLALPSDVPLADLLPALLRHAGGELADDGTAHGGWALSRLGGPPLDTGRTVGQLEIRDGEVLRFTPRAATGPEIVFDDVVDAVATAVRDRAGPWLPANTRRFGTGFATAALLGGTGVVLFAGPPQLPGALVALGLGFALLLAATLISRVGGDARTGALFGLVALAYGAVGGLLLLAGERRLTELAAPDVLLAATILVVFAAAATVAVGEYPQLFLGAVAVGVALSLGAAIGLVFGTGPAVAAAVVGTAAFGLFPPLPMLAYRLARLPVPGIPTGPEDLRSDRESVDGQRVLALGERADEIHTGLVTTTAALVVGAVAVLVLGADWRGWILSTVLALVLLLRARPYRGRAQRLPVLVAGSLALGAVAIGVFVASDITARLGPLLGGLVAAAAVSLVYGVAVAGKRISPLWGRQLDVVEILLILAAVPLAVWITGLYGWIATIGR